MKDEKLEVKNKLNSSREWRKIFVKRLLKFGVGVIRMTNEFPKTPAGFAIASQIIKSATSIGANFVEAQDASSTKDFIQKLSIALREAKETSYWLQIVQMSGLVSETLLAETIKENNEIIAILVASVKSSKLKL